MYKLTLLILVLLNSNNFLESKSMKCEGSDTSKWNNCRAVITKDLTAYVGEFKDGLPHGKGTLTYSDGAVYSGGFKFGKEHGIGIFICFAHGSKYEGEFQNGKKHGNGVYTYPDGVIYEGDWSEGKRNGLGTLLYTDGSKLSGEFFEDKYVKEIHRNN